MRQRVLASILGFVCGLSLAAQEGALPPLDALEFARMKDAKAERISSSSPNPASNNDSKQPIPGETIVLADLKGPGVVTHIWLTIAANEYAWPRLVRLRVYYDGNPEPSVDAPVGDYFAVGHGFERWVKSEMVRATSDGRARNGYWPMPFAKSCRITLTNEGRRRLDHVYYHVDWSKVPALPPDTLYFHARYKQELPAQAEKKVYTFLDVKGRGFYAGTVLSVVQPEAGWFGEGDERIYVDGEKEPSIIGTGSEDYFNDAWGLHVVDGPYYGVTVADGTGLGSRMTGYRWHIKDPIPFKKSFRFDMEHLGWTFNNDGSLKSPFGTRDDLYSSVAFWYQEGVATGLWPVPYGSARLPQGNAIQFEVEKVASPGRRRRRARPRCSRTSSGRRTSSSSRRRGRARGSRSRSRSRKPATTSSTRRSRWARTTGSTTCSSTASPRSRRSSSTSRARTSGRSSPSTDTRTRPTSAGTTRSAGRA